MSGKWEYERHSFIHSFIYCCLQSDLLEQGSEDMSPLKYKVTYITLGKPDLEVRNNLFTLLRGRGPLWSSQPIFKLLLGPQIYTGAWHGHVKCCKPGWPILPAFMSREIGFGYPSKTLPVQESANDRTKGGSPLPPFKSF